MNAWCPAWTGLRPRLSTWTGLRLTSVRWVPATTEGRTDVVVPEVLGVVIVRCHAAPVVMALYSIQHE
eukprot:49908-Eustigmatos_ZCMA.PRE.1